MPAPDVRPRSRRGSYPTAVTPGRTGFAAPVPPAAALARPPAVTSQAALDQQQQLSRAGITLPQVPGPLALPLNQTLLQQLAALSQPQGGAKSGGGVSTSGYSGKGIPGGSTWVGSQGTSRIEWANAFLNRLGIKPNAQNVKAVAAWETAESVHATGGSNQGGKWNPLNTTQDMPGGSRYNSVGVQNYTSFQQGLAATIRTIRNGYYQKILAALRSGTSAQIEQAIAKSPWGTKRFPF